MFLPRVLSCNVIRVRSASLVRLVTVDVWIQCRGCHLIHFAETGFPRVPAKLPNLIVSPNTGKRESVRNVPEHIGGKSAALCWKCQSPVHKSICDLCYMPLGGMTLTVSAPTAHSVTVTSARTYVLLPTDACGIFVHPV